MYINFVEPLTHWTEHIQRKERIALRAFVRSKFEDRQVQHGFSGVDVQLLTHKVAIAMANSNKPFI